MASQPGYSGGSPQRQAGANPIAPQAWPPNTPAGAVPQQISPAHRLGRFPIFWLMVLNFCTLNLFGTIWLNLMHGRMPRNRHNDPSAGAAIGLLFVPVFNLYWLFFTYTRLIRRINEQRVLRGMSAAAPMGLAIAFCILTLASIIPFLGIATALLNLFVIIPLFLSFTQCAVNALVDVSGPNEKIPADPARIAAADGRAIAGSRRAWGFLLLMLSGIGVLAAVAFLVTPIVNPPRYGGFVDNEKMGFYLCWSVSAVWAVSMYGAAALCFSGAARAMRSVAGAAGPSAGAGGPVPILAGGVLLLLALGGGTFGLKMALDRKPEPRPDGERATAGVPARGRRVPRGRRPQPPSPRFAPVFPPGPLDSPGPAPAPAAAPVSDAPLEVGEEYLRDLEPAEVSVLERDEHQLLRDVTVNKINYAHSLYMHPPKAGTPAKVTFNLDAKCSRLTGAVALNDHFFPAASPLTFKLLGDEKLLWQSPPVKQRNTPAPASFDVDLTGVHELTLLVECPGSESYAHAVWIEPRLTRAEE